MIDNDSVYRYERLNFLYYPLPQWNNKSIVSGHVASYIFFPPSFKKSKFVKDSSGNGKPLQL